MSKKRLVFATGNQGKVNEFRQMLGDDYEILSMKDIGVDIDIVEDGKTFEENAVIKAKAVMEETGEMVLADDSGFEVDYLNKEPGIRAVLSLPTLQAQFQRKQPAGRAERLASLRVAQDTFQPALVGLSDVVPAEVFTEWAAD